MPSNTRLVYSTETGKVEQKNSPQKRPKGDGIVRVKRETKGRKGKGVSIIEGLDLDDTELKKVAKELKQYCGTGGTVKDHAIEIQGDNRDQILTYFNKKNIKAIKAGG